MKQNSNNSQQIKNEINNLRQAREAIDRGNDVSGSMIKLNKTMNKIQPLLTKQQIYLKNFFSQQESTGQQNKQSEARRYISRICQITMEDIGNLLDVGQSYFSVDFKNSWNKIKNSFEKELANQKELIDQNNMLEFMFKIINVKDYMTCNFMKSFLYRKCLLWKDLNIIEQGFVHAEKKEMNKLLENEMVERGFIPTKPVFDWMGFNVKGSWNMNRLEHAEMNLNDILKITNDELQAVFEVVRNYASLTVEQRSHEDISRNQKNVKSLRKQIEDSHNNYLALEKKYREAALKDEKSDVVELRDKIVNLQQIIQEREAELKKVKFQFRDSSSQINSFRQKIKDLEADLSRISNLEMKKLKDIEMIQGSLIDEFGRIHKKISNFGSIFQFESDGKKSLAKEIMANEKTIDRIVGVLSREKNKNRDLKQEITRLNIIILELSKKLEKRNSEASQVRESESDP